MSRLVHIVISDRGWILERLANEIAKRVSGVSFDTAVDRGAPIQYYITYGCRRERVSPVELALFTHREADPATAERFMAVAKEVDVAVAMSKATGRILTDAGVENHVISPGVDLDRFAPKLKIAVVGRTYHTGRKGEALINAVMDMPDIEWFFTGDGWPGQGLHIDEEALPDLYRSVDYVLVPALNEGGPMCVLEALASGVPVIGADVGWVHDFPHIPFEHGNPQSLRKVLGELRDQKFALRSAVLDMTWDRWAAEHDKLFSNLVKSRRIAPSSTAVAKRRIRSAALLSHGLESTVVGGPSVRVPKTAQLMREQGLEASALRFPSADLTRFDLAHAYNIWPPTASVRIARRMASIGTPFVFSPILLDLSEAALWQADLLLAFRKAASPEEAEERMAWARDRQAARVLGGKVPEPEPGYLDAIREIAELSDAFVFLGEKERSLASKMLSELPAISRTIRNPVDAALFSEGDPRLFQSAYNVDEYVLCVARIEHRKNQLMLALALRDTGIPLVLVGHPGNDEYLQLVKSFGGPNLTIVERLDPGSEMLRSAIAGARVVTLPSWAEGAPLAALEAGAAGARMVLSDRSSEIEYFGDRALYCDPADPQSIRNAILKAWEEPWTEESRLALTEHVAENFSWGTHIEATMSLYEEVADRRAGGQVPPGVKRWAPEKHALPTESGQPLRVVLDLTTMANNASLRAGIVRVEASLAQNLRETDDVEIRYVVWRSPEIGFVDIPHEIISRGLLADYLRAVQLKPAQLGSTWSGARLLVVGSSWMQNGTYAEALVTLASANQLELSVLIHDLTPYLFPHWFMEGYSPPFIRNLTLLLEKADRLLTYSENTASDVRAMALELDLDICSIQKFRLADDIGTFSLEMSERGLEIEAQFSRRPFILATGAIHARKNYGLLYDCWSMLGSRMDGSCPDLVIVGGVSWNGAELARMIREDKTVSRYIHIVADVDDAALDWLYRNCLFTVYPSLYEGWGLPVGESLSYGKICIASNRSSVPEIAPELTDLLDPLDRAAWAARIQHYATSKSAREAREAVIRANYSKTSWTDTAVGVRDALLAPKMVERRDLYTLGDIVVLAKSDPPSRYLRGGWYPPEPWGTWTSGQSAHIRMVLSAVPDEDLVLTVVAKHFSAVGRTNSCTVVVNGTEVDDWEFDEVGQMSPGDMPFVISSALIPKSLVDEDGCVHVELFAPGRYKVRDVSPASQDRRDLGLGVACLALQRLSQAVDMPELLSTRIDVRQALNVPVRTSWAQAFRESPARPAYPLHVWVRPWEAVGRKLITAGKSTLQSFSFEDHTLRFRGRIAAPDLTLGLTFKALIVSDACEESGYAILILANGGFVGEWLVSTSEPQIQSIEIPQSLLKHSEPLKIVLACHAIGNEPGGKEDLQIGIAEIYLDAPSKVVERDYPQVSSRGLGEIDQLPDQTIAEYLESGWFSAEGTRAWSIGDLGRFSFSVNIGPERDEVLILDVAAIGTGEDGDAVTMHSDDMASVARVPIRSPFGDVGGGLAILDLGSVRPSGYNQFSLRLLRNAATNPKRMGLSEDDRDLGVSIMDPRIVRLPPLQAGLVLDVAAPQFSEFSYMAGWHEGELGLGRWSSSRYGDFWVRLPEKTTPEMQLILHLGKLDAGSGSMQTVSVLINDEPAGTTEIGDTNIGSIALDLAPEFATPGVLFKVSIDAGGVLVPAELGLSIDERPLGILLRAVELQTFGHSDARDQADPSVIEHRSEQRASPGRPQPRKRNRRKTKRK